MNDFQHRTVWRRRLTLFGLIFLFWTVAALAFTAQLYFTRILSESPLTLRRVVTEQFIYPYLWALATPLVLWLAGRFPVGQGQWRRSVPLHFLFALVLTVLINGSFHVLYHFTGENRHRPYVPLATARTIIYNSSETVGIYGIILLFSNAFNYYRRYREGELRTSQLQAQLAQAQLQALKMQLQPHFLFNTLHSISALIYKDAEAADKMIARLGDFLRLTLENSGTQEVTLRQELEFLKCYLEIERIRFHDRLTTHLDIDPQTLDSPVPNLILQPIVENANRHGIAPRSAPGRIEIQAKRNNGFVRIEVKDNGPGLPPNQSANSRLKDGGVGLANTRARLAQLYGESHRFELANAPEGGLVVTMEIPANARTAR
ncbi:MAG TPA: histidine kinase [Pyrinomonadaceae bacterium]|nr:histidine kinase [Pyrinomonadaceae bacterium]